MKRIRHQPSLEERVKTTLKLTFPGIGKKEPAHFRASEDGGIVASASDPSGNHYCEVRITKNGKATTRCSHFTGKAWTDLGHVQQGGSVSPAKLAKARAMILGTDDPDVYCDKRYGASVKYIPAIHRGRSPVLHFAVETIYQVLARRHPHMKVSVRVTENHEIVASVMDNRKDVVTDGDLDAVNHELKKKYPTRTFYTGIEKSEDNNLSFLIISARSR